MANNFLREITPLSRLGVLVAQLESIVASAAHKPPDALLCFDLLSDLVSAIEDEPKESLLLCQRKCEDALYNLLVLGARRPVRHLASVAMARIIVKGDGISIYSRASSLQGFLSDGKRSEPLRVAGAAQCLGELYRFFGRKITSGLRETTIIVTKLMKFNEDFVRQEALHMLQNALEGSGGSAASSAYTDAYRLVMRLAVGDKSFIVRIAAAKCLKAFANIGGPGLGVGELENSANQCVKALEDPIPSVRDAFAEALGAVLALGMNPEAQVQPRGKAQIAPKKLEGGLQKHLVFPFVRASGFRSRNIRVGLTLSWVFFLQAIRLKYLHPDSELQSYALQVMEMLRMDSSSDAHALACVLYVLRVGVTDQMTEPTQRSFLVFLGKQLQSSDTSSSMKIAAFRTLSYALKTLGEVPLEFKEVLDSTIVAALSHSTPLVRVEAALTLRALAEVEPTCVAGLISYGITTLSALRENVKFEKGSSLQTELDSLHGQSTVLAALVSILPKLHLGYPARLPKSVLEVSKKMLMESSGNPVAATAEKEAGWLLVSSLLASMVKEELEDQVFDILSLWAALFTGNLDNKIKQSKDLIYMIRVWSAAMDALAEFIRCFITTDSVNKGILLQPVLLYLSRALSCISFIASKEQQNVKSALDLFTIRTLIAYSSLSDPMAYKGDHSQILQICTTPFRDAAVCEESSCLRILLDKRDAWLGPWIPGRDWLEDELRAFQGGKDGDLPCVWEAELSSFPQPENISNMLVNQKLLCFGTMFSSQDSGGMLSLLGTIDQCFKAGKKQLWHASSVTNICVGLLAGLKALLALRPQPLGSEILSLAQTIFLNILSEGDICPAQRRAASEGLGLLARLGNDFFTARLARLLLGDVTGTADSCFAGSIAFALGCIHRSAGGMALSSLVPSTVNCLSLLAKSPVAGLQVWSLHGLLSTIEAAGLSYVSQVQATLGLALDILLSEENAWVNLQQGVGRLINAIVAVLGPELAPGSIFFSRCKAVVAEISCQQEAATLLESVRFTQQLVLFAPQAVTVHSHVQTLLPTLSSGQPSLRHLAVSTLRHLIEKDPDSIIYEKIEDTLFHMLDEETDPEIGNLVRTAIKRLLYASSPKCLSHWLSILRTMVLATPSGRDLKTGDNRESDSVNGNDGETRSNFGDDENMVSGFKTSPSQAYAFGSTSMNSRRDKHLRYRTRLFAAECLSLLPSAVGKGPAHFDLSLARKQSANEKISGDWLVLHVQELISVAYQMSTIHFENMRPIGVGLLSTIMDKFELVPDPDLPGHLLLEQYQAQLVSAVRTALDASSGPILLEAGLQLATKILTYGILSGDQVAVRRIFSLISRPLNNFTDLYYPSFAEWVSCKIKIRLLAAHASLKCYTYAFLRKQHATESDEYLALLPLFSESSSILGKQWVSVLKDHTYICLRLHLKQNWKSFLDEIKSPLVSAKLQPCLQEVWPVIFQAVALDALPANFGSNISTEQENMDSCIFISGYSMVQLKSEDFRFLWGFALFVLFQGEDASCNGRLIPLGSAKPKCGVGSPVGDASPQALSIYEIVLPVFQFLSAKQFFSVGFLTADICREMLQVFSYFICMEDSWDSLAISVLLQVVQNCPNDFFETDKFSSLVVELSLAYLLKLFQSTSYSSDNPEHENMISLSFTTAATVLERLRSEKHVNAILGYLLTGYRCLEAASTEVCISKSINLIQGIIPLLKTYLDDKSELHDDDFCLFNTIVGACLSMVSNVTKECTESIHLSGQKKSDSSKLPKLKLAFALKEMFSLAKLACECLGVTRENISLFFTVIQHCNECIRTVICNSNIQIQTIGFQVLKNTIQRSTSSGHNSFVLFITGELLEDIFTTIVAMLKSPVNREKVAIASECLRILVIVQTLSKVHESRKSLMNLLLQAIVFIFSVTDDLSQEMNELRKTAGHLISQLAQVPSSVVFLKDALLAMPVENRQQLQGIIRASVPQEHPATETKSPTPSLVIKLPIQTEETGDQDLAKSIPAKNSDFRSEEESKKDEFEGGGGEEEEEDDDDDWDTFQSFPASTSELVANANAEADVEEPEIIEKSSTSDIYTGNLDVEENADSYTPKHLEEEEEEDADKKSSVVGTASDDDETKQKEEPHVSQDEISKPEKSDDDRHDEKSQEAVTGEIDLVIPKHQSGDSAETNQKEKPRVSQDEISEAEKSDGDGHYEKSQEAVTGEIDLVVPKHQPDDSLEQIQTVDGDGYHGTDERVTSDNDSVDVALSNDADQPSLVRDDKESRTGTEDISPESSGDLHSEATSDKEQPKETDDDVKDETESNAEQDEDRNKTNS